MPSLRIGTRGSPLALYQAHAVAALLRERAGAASEIVVIRTSGDRLADAPLSEAGGKRLFVKEIEDALLAGDVDLAVHSSKDLSAALPDGLAIGAVLPREDARDAVVLPEGTRGVGDAFESIAQAFGPGARIGTSSVRRSAQLVRLWPGERFAPIRGNLDTRLRKLDAGEHDAIILAAAGLIRLERAHRISAALPIEASMPAPGQGIIAVEVRGDDRAVRPLVAHLNDDATGAALDAERAVVIRLGGGCQMPLGAYAQLSGGTLTLTAVVISLDGSQVVRADGRSTAREARQLGLDVGDRLLAAGAGDILADVARQTTPADGSRS
jgi:hydroxymethylbilane synthase